MIPDGHDLDSVTGRLEQLEKHYRRLKVVCLISVAAMSCVFLLGQGAPGGQHLVADQVDARVIVLRDGAGRIRGWLGTAQEGTRLVFFDENGEQRVGIGLTADQRPAMALMERTDKPLLVIGVDPRSWPSVLLYDPQGRKRAALTAEEDWASIFFFDKNEKRRAGLGIVESGASLNLFDERGEKRSGLSVGKEASSLVFFDEYGKKRAGLGIATKDDPAMGFFDAAGRTRVAINTTERQTAVSLYGTNLMESTMLISTNGPNLLLYNAAGEREWTAR